MKTTDVEHGLTDALEREASSVVVRPDLARVVADSEDDRRPTAVTPLRTRRRVSAAVAVVAATLAAAVGVGAFVTREGTHHDPQQLVAASAGQSDVSEGMGRWSSLAPGPVGMASGLTHGSELSDGRILFWGIDAAYRPGDTPAIVEGSEEPDGPRASSVAVAVYAPTDGSWRAVDTAAVSDLEIQDVRVAGDRLLVVGSGLDRDDRVAMYDAAVDRWTTSVVPGTEREQFNGVAWTGEVAALVRLHHGMGDEAVPDWVGSRPSGEDPKVWRWTPGNDRWSVGEPPPLTPRAHGGWAFDGDRLATVGGVDAADVASGAGSQSSGAIYEIASDTWTVLPDAPWPAMHPELAWDGDRLVYAGGSLGRSLSEETSVNRHAAWSADDGWVELPGPPPSPDTDGGPPTLRRTDPLDDADIDRPGTVVPAATDRVFGRATSGSVFLDGAWETVPVGDPMTLRWGDRVLATSPTVGGAVDEFQVAVRGGSDHWVRAADAPVTDLWRPALVLVGDRLYVVGTPRQSIWQPVDPVSEAWVLDLTA